MRTSAEELLLVHWLDTPNKSLNVSKSTQECMTICLRKKNGTQYCIVAIGGRVTVVLVQSVTNRFNFRLKNNTATGENGHLLCPALSHICGPFKDIWYHTMLSFETLEQGGKKRGGNCERGKEREALSPHFSRWISETARCCPSQVKARE